MSLPTARMNLAIRQGDTFRAARRWRVGPSKDALAPIDFTGCTAKAQIRPTTDSPIVLHEFSTDDGSITLSADGWIRLYIPDGVTQQFAWGCEAPVWDLEVVFTDGDKRTMLAGRARLVPGVTK